jgi:hypothetical protein
MSTRWTGKNLSVDRDEIHADSGSINQRVSRFLSKSPTQKLSEGLTPVSGIGKVPPSTNFGGNGVNQAGS